MNKKQKDNLIKALQEVNAPDKKVLLERIEDKKNFREQYEYLDWKERQRQKSKKSLRSFALAFCAGVVVFIIIASFVISFAVKMFSSNEGGGNDIGGGTNIDGNVPEDYKDQWRFEYDGYISFQDIDETLEEYNAHTELEWLYDYKSGWRVVKTQMTQDEKSFREYYEYDGYKVEVTVFTKGSKIPYLDTRYYTFLSATAYRNSSHGIVYSGSLIFDGAPYRNYYVMYREDAVYIVYSNMLIFDEFIK